MKDFKVLRETCLKEVIDAGIIPGNITKWTINTRSRSRWGLCIIQPNGECEIQIASRLLEDEHVSEKSCKDTIIHEILHTCKGCKGHTGTWKRYAEIMNAKYGYDIKRVTSNEEKGLEKYIVNRRTPKYVYICTGCGQIVTKTRTCKFTKHYRLYGCGICGKRYAFKPYK